MNRNYSDTLQQTRLLIAQDDRVVSDSLQNNEQEWLASSNCIELIDLESEIPIEESQLDNMNFRDFCGSQEFDIIKRQSLKNLSMTHIPRAHVTSSSNLNKQPDLSSASFVNTKNGGGFFLSADCHSSLSSSSSSSVLSMNKDEGKAHTESNSSSDKASTKSESQSVHAQAIISEYRLTLTDLIELNLVDVSNGLIINPLNGVRITISDAMKLELLNTDVKEIANTFYLNAASASFSSKSIQNIANALKLTVREAIKIGVLNPSRNEINLSPSNPALRLNLYQAKKQNLILKPLTLSEAFLKNLIQPNGYVRNPINSKFYAFESLIMNDLDRQQPLYVFDFDTKHIIDPNDCEKRLLSLREAIEIGLILPRTFELNTNLRGKPATKNLYEAFLNSTKFNFGLLVYKPEIENVYVKLMTNKKTNESENHAAHNRLAVILSKRDKIGLCEALNLNVINLKNKTYKFILTNNELNSEKISLDEATFRFNLVDRELIILLNQPVGLTVDAQSLSILDCITHKYLHLEKNLFQNPLSNEFMSLDSQQCRALIGDETVKKIKKLITRVNIKSYVISMNNNTMAAPLSSMTSLRSASMHNASNNQLVNFKPPTVIHNKLFHNQKATLGSKSTDCLRVKPIEDTNQTPSVLQYSTLNKEETPPLMSQTTPTPTPSETAPLSAAAGTKTNLIKETRSYILDYVVVPTPGNKSPSNVPQQTQRISILEAKKRGILNLEQGLYIDTFKNITVSIDEAIKAGLIGARMAMCEKNFVLDEPGVIVDPLVNSKIDLKVPVLMPVLGKPVLPDGVIETKRTHETSTLTIESILDAKTGIRLSVGDAINAGILDQAQLAYKNTITGQLMSLNEAYERGFVKGNMCSKNFTADYPPPAEMLNSSDRNQLIYTKNANGDETIVESEEEKCFRINKMYDPMTKTFISLDMAIKSGIFNRENGVYVDPIDGKEMTIKEAHLVGLIQAELITNLEALSDKVCRINVVGENSRSSSEDSSKKPLLYEVKEVEEIKAISKLADLLPNTIHRIELVVDDDEVNEETKETDDHVQVGKVRLRNSFRAGINNGRVLERRIPSAYESGVPPNSETLVIDDVRQSTMLDIDGITHVYKNEVSIDSELISTSTPNSSGAALNNLQKNPNIHDNNSAAERTNKTLVMIDKILRSGGLDLSNDQKIRRRSICKDVASTVHNINNLQRSDPLKISIGTNGSLNNLYSGKNEADIRAQFERALKQLENDNYPKIKNVKLSTSSSLVSLVFKSFFKFSLL